jgi:hypothetical protein
VAPRGGRSGKVSVCARINRLASARPHRFWIGDSLSGTDSTQTLDRLAFLQRLLVSRGVRAASLTDPSDGSSGLPFRLCTLCNDDPLRTHICVGKQQCAPLSPSIQREAALETLRGGVLQFNVDDGGNSQSRVVRAIALGLGPLPL